MRHPEWVRYAALGYIRAMADYEKQARGYLDRMAELSAKLEALGAQRYDREGSAAGYTDTRAETLDLLAQLKDSLEAHIANGEREYQEALDLFIRDEDATIVWLKYGKRMTWDAVGRKVGFTGRTCRTHAPMGFRYIFDHMPLEYRRVPVNAEEVTYR